MLMLLWLADEGEEVVRSKDDEGVSCISTRLQRSKTWLVAVVVVEETATGDEEDGNALVVVDVVFLAPITSTTVVAVAAADSGTPSTPAEGENIAL